MLLSEFLQNRIDRAKAVIYTLSTPGWDVIREEQLDHWELQAFRAWTNLPIARNMDDETHRLVLEHQMQAKFAERFRKVGQVYKNQMEQDMALLVQIQNGWEEDPEVPAEGPQPVQTLRESLRQGWVRLKEEIARHVNV